MKLKLVALCCLLSTLGMALTETVLYDPINKTEIVFTATSRYEDLAIDELNKQQEVGYSYFVFADAKYENKRLAEFHEKFKTYAVRGTFRKELTKQAQKQHEAYLLEEYADAGYYRLPQYNGYLVQDLDLRPISYLANTLTFSYTVEYFLIGTDESFEYTQLYLLNLDDFSFNSLKSINHKIDQEALREALIKKWQSITDHMPNKNWLKMEQVKISKNQFVQENADPPNNMDPYFADSLVSYAVRKANLGLVEVYWTGTGVMVRLVDALSWFKRPMPIIVQIHLNPQEAKEAFKNCPTLTSLNKVETEKIPKWRVDPKDMLSSQFNLHFNRQFINFLKVEDDNIKSIESVYRDNPKDSQYVFNIHYEEGRAQMVLRGGRRNKHYYDSLFWDKDKVYASIVNSEIHTGSRREYQRSLRLQKRNKNGNTQWFLSTGSALYMEEYTYYSNKVAYLRYDMFDSGIEYRTYQKRPQWYTWTETGFCFENGECASVDKDGKPSQRFKNSYAYKDGKLLQILGEQQKYTLFFYDDEGRINNIEDQLTGQKKLNFFYEGDSEIPYRVEKIDGHSRNTYYYVHYD